MRNRSRRLVVRFPLKWVVVIRVTAAEPEDEARQQVSRQKEGSPAFVLADVDVFVGAAAVEALLILAEDDVAQSHCRT